MPKKCEFRKRDGNVCCADAQLGKTLCVFHDPAKSAEGARARRAGGISRSQRAIVLSPEAPDCGLRSIQDVAILLSESINLVRRGQLDPRVANAIGYLSGILLKALEQGRTEERLKYLEGVVGLNKGTETEVFDFVSAKESTSEQPGTATKDN